MKHSCSIDSFKEGGRKDKTFQYFFSNLKSKHHVEFLALEPGDGVSVLSHGQRFSTDTKDKPS